MERVRRLGVPAPGVYLVDQTQRKIYMEYLNEGMTVKELLNGLPSFDQPSKFPTLIFVVLVCDKLAEMIATNLAALH